MVTIAQVYANVKSFVLQTFESKADEEINLPLDTEICFEYKEGDVCVYPYTVTNEYNDFNYWSGTQPIYSDFTLPYNHEISVTFDSTPNIQVACSDTSNNWIYAQNIGYSNNTKLSYRNSSNGVVSISKSFTVNTSKTYKFRFYENTLKFYVDDELIYTQATYDTLSITRRIRIYNNANAINTLTVRKIRG